MIIRVLVWIARYFLALTFIFSGFVKGVDPLGSAYKFSDYFAAFNLGFLEPLALVFAFLLCAAELYIGLLLLFRVKDLIAIWGSFLFMAVFTPLTLVLALYNPVSDCGCFGDAIVLTNWETFFKNIPLLLATMLLFLYRKKLTTVYGLRLNNFLAVFLLAISFLPSIHGYRNLPLFDFRPFSVGTNIPEAMFIPPDAPVDEYKTILLYEKNGRVEEFNEENMPWQDTTWKFVDSRSELVTRGYIPKIDDFVITDMDERDVTESILHNSGYYLLAVSYRLDLAHKASFDKLNELYYKALEQGIGFACVTSSSPGEIDRFVGQTGVAFPFLLADEIMLKTVIRANPGLMLLNNGTIIAKWHYRNIPETDYFQGNLMSKSLTSLRLGIDSVWVIVLLVSLLGIFLGIRLLKNAFNSSRKP
ncbi:MAG: BT_3928 family protein [Tenuifilaceae bacterium]|jgi:hypothetical protein|nr:DoxX family protein [Bacteroidota bacterium]MZP82383.1 DoxX family protein [Bacteroidales bacterium]NLH57352.1 DoxX family protein [Rikenellaceae bacterium]OQC64695.1 MAG: hypothetical protein BWX49_00535 [Bacteroidetes bacterium ADurb.Bin008]HNV81031.1 DoxX family protein [Tenuifilaceae bacterium]